MTTLSKRTIWLLTLGAFFAFFVFGFSDNLKGPVLPSLLQELKFNYSLGGTILLGAYIGFMVATMTTGFLADIAGQKTVLVLAGVCLAIGMGGFSFFNNSIFLTASMVILGFGLGSLELGCNALIVELHSTDKGRYLNLMAVLHGMGSMIAPLYAGIMLTASISWRLVVRLDIILIGLLISYFLLMPFPKTKTGKREKLDLKHLSLTAFTPRMIWFYTAMSLYVATELAIASWLVEFLQKEREYNVAHSTQSLSIFFGLMMLGRFVGSFLVERLGYLKSILISTLCASACVAIGMFGASELAFFLPVSGFFLSILFPTITAAVSDSHNENINSILGLLFTFAGLGGVLGPWLVGIASDLGGLKVGFGLVLVFCLLTAGSISILIRLGHQKN